MAQSAAPQQAGPFAEKAANDTHLVAATAAGVDLTNKAPHSPLLLERYEPVKVWSTTDGVLHVESAVGAIMGLRVLDADGNVVMHRVGANAARIDIGHGSEPGTHMVEVRTTHGNSVVKAMLF